MSLISAEYRALNVSLHESRPDYGTGGHKCADVVSKLSLSIGARSILDYGAGKGTLAKCFLPGTVAQYDPCIPGLDSRPAPADLVVCTDVLEHIEPDYLDAVLDDIASLTKMAVFFVIATRPAKKILADGRNAHLIQEPPSWWLPQLERRWALSNVHIVEGEFTVTGKKHARAA